MTRRTVVSFSLSALLLGGSVVGCAGESDHVASASDGMPEAASTAADRAAQALASGDSAATIRFAETAVAARPQQASFRLLLAQGYMRAGRFTSAAEAFGDVLRLDPSNGKAALDLALAQIGLGQWADARETLGAHAATIPAVDRGLAVALAGDPASAVEILTATARSPGAGVKVRQNLALALALAGRWPEARVVASADLSPAEVDRRMTQWASFAQPSGAADQVAALLGVVPVVDAGQPTALALVAPTPIVTQPVGLAAASPAPQTQVASSDAAPKPIASVRSLATTEPMPIERAQVSQVVAVTHRSAGRLVTSHSAALHSVARPPLSHGTWVVQVGAFRNMAVARDGWARVVHRDPAFRGRIPEGVTFKARVGEVYRLSVGGFARNQADAVCRSYRARGGACFVRAAAGDQIAQWARREVQLASR